MDDCHALCEMPKCLGARGEQGFRNSVNELADDCVKVYLRNRAGHVFDEGWPHTIRPGSSAFPSRKGAPNLPRREAQYWPLNMITAELPEVPRRSQSGEKA